MEIDFRSQILGPSLLRFSVGEELMQHCKSITGQFANPESVVYALTTQHFRRRFLQLLIVVLTHDCSFTY